MRTSSGLMKKQKESWEWFEHGSHSGQEIIRIRPTEKCGLVIQRAHKRVDEDTGVRAGCILDQGYESLFLSMLLW